MSSTIRLNPAVTDDTPKSADAYPKSSAVSLKPPPQASSSVIEHHRTAGSLSATALSPQALSSTDVSYVESLMGALPAQKMQEILLRTGIPMPANLGPNLDTMA